MSILEELFGSTLENFKIDLKQIIDGRWHHKQINANQASTLLEAIEKLEKENLDLKDKLKQINEISRVDEGIS